MRRIGWGAFLPAYLVAVLITVVALGLTWLHARTPATVGQPAAPSRQPPRIRDSRSHRAIQPIPATCERYQTSCA
jgi:hypothetical protein